MRIITFAVMLISAASAIGGECRRCSFYSNVDEKTLVAEVTRDRIATTPIWLAKAENPPLSARRAIQLARKQMESLVADRNGWRLESVQLLDVGDLHWMYLVEFMQFSEDVALGDSTLRIPVLMDGAVIGPRPTEGKH